MKLIPLTQDKYALVDDADYGWLSKFRWHAQKSGKRWYANSKWHDGTKRIGIAMHRLLRPFAEVEVDHRNGNGLFNSRGNLRDATRSQNHANAVKFSRQCTSSYKGVHWCKALQKWRTKIKGKHVGYFTSETDATKAYDMAALETFGEFARLNYKT